MQSNNQKAVIIHDKTHAHLAFDVAKEVSSDLVFVSPPGAVHYLGLPYIQRFVQSIKAPDHVKWDYVCDCGDAQGKAHQAIMMGFKYIRYTGNAASSEALKSVALRFGSTVLHKTFEVLDLMHQKDPYHATKEWLTS